MKKPEIGTTLRTEFTLIELLLVISIIAILAWLLLPALSSARRKAQTVECIGNLKQNGTALTMYANDNNGYIVTYAKAGEVNTYAKIWHEMIIDGPVNTMLNTSATENAISARSPLPTVTRRESPTLQ